MRERGREGGREGGMRERGREGGREGGMRERGREGGREEEGGHQLCTHLKTDSESSRLEVLWSGQNSLLHWAASGGRATTDGVALDG